MYVDRIHTDGEVLERKRLLAQSRFLGAGSAGTTRLLVKAKAKGFVPDLPDGVGTGWGNNGDRVFAMTSPLVSPRDHQGGSACVGMPDYTDPAGPLMIVTGPVPFPVDVGTTTMIGLRIVDGRGVRHYDAGRVHGQPGLYVVDGAKIPGSTGACNPSMTIAALAGYGADRIVSRDLDRVF
ncbi:GMC family oxidoreductase [Rhodococcus pyridinivorans]|uniref:GMC oxidoreductase n=1 Tax=Rhodococcus pyridinivorans TaxID=103816 RepID=UPI00200B0F56|nr:GMC oxidoreductase [Rhodococcus pyridinivorans]UPW03387.1 GMC family oxidoreductase [Rhodococcus pyridinivorans]